MSSLSRPSTGKPLKKEEPRYLSEVLFIKILSQNLDFLHKKRYNFSSLIDRLLILILGGKIWMFKNLHKNQ